MAGQDLTCLRLVVKGGLPWRTGVLSALKEESESTREKLGGENGEENT